MKSIPGLKHKATAIKNEDVTMADLPSLANFAVHNQSNSSATNYDSDDDLPPPPKKMKAVEEETYSRPVNADTSTAEVEKLKEMEAGYLTEQRKVDFEKVLAEAQKLRIDFEKLKVQNEALQFTITSRDSMIRALMPLVHVGAAVRARFFELAKKNAGVGEAIMPVVKEGDKAIAEGNIRADMAMIELGFPFVPNHPLIGRYDANTLYKDVYFKALYTRSFDEMIGRSKENFRAFPLRKLEICEISATMTSLTDPNNRHNGDEMDKFKDLVMAFENEWTNHICRLWPDDQRRLNTAFCWPPMHKIVRDMGVVVEDALKKSKEVASPTTVHPTAGSASSTSAVFTSPAQSPSASIQTGSESTKSSLSSPYSPSSTLCTSALIASSPLPSTPVGSASVAPTSTVSNHTASATTDAASSDSA
ncbi:hypothetical protein BKA61DRAFT_569346 [Leptodontidium sp. MPI-SDFR-AT-0119]|nr:hypothetical protein BKA61DRAFT_569346 [Leptodontidium sp. MPI-SDFR-AT-0119]